MARNIPAAGLEPVELGEDSLHGMDCCATGFCIPACHDRTQFTKFIRIVTGKGLFAFAFALKSRILLKHLISQFF
jgi:hypothetical protein